MGLSHSLPVLPPNAQATQNHQPGDSTQRSISNEHKKKSLSSVFLEVRAVLACHHGDPRVRQETPSSVLENFDLASLGVP